MNAMFKANSSELYDIFTERPKEKSCYKLLWMITARTSQCLGMQKAMAWRSLAELRFAIDHPFRRHDSFIAKAVCSQQ